MGERVESREHDAVAAPEGVVGEHRGNRDREPERGHDQRLADRARHLVERALAAHADRDERVIHAPHRPEQPDEGRGAADGSERGEARLEPRRLLVDHAAHGAGEEVRRAAGLVQPVGAVPRVMARRDDRVIGEMGKRLVGVVLLEPPLDGRERRRVPEHREEPPGAPFRGECLQALHHDEIPGRDRHRDEDDQDRPADDVGLREKVGEAQAVDRFHAFLSLPRNGSSARSRAA